MGSNFNLPFEKRASRLPAAIVALAVVGRFLCQTYSRHVHPKTHNVCRISKWKAQYFPCCEIREYAVLLKRGVRTYSRPKLPDRIGLCPGYFQPLLDSPEWPNYSDDNPKYPSLPPNECFHADSSRYLKGTGYEYSCESESQTFHDTTQALS